MSVDQTAWTCPDCRKTYRSPGHWETRIFLSVRRAAQVYHAELHGRQDIVRNRRRTTDPAIDYGTPIDASD